MGGAKWPSVGVQPQNMYDHATQLIADVEALEIGINAEQGKPRKQIPAESILPFLRSCKKPAEKAKDQPSLKDFSAQLEASFRDVKSIKDDIKVVKNTVTNTPLPQRQGSQPSSYAKAAAWAANAASASPPLSGIIPTSNLTSTATEKERVVIIKLADPDQIEAARGQQPANLKIQIDTIMKQSSNTRIRNTKITAAKQLKSGDLATYTAMPEGNYYLKRYADDWVKGLGPHAYIPIPTYEVIMHGIRLDTIDMAKQTEMAMELKQWSNHVIPNAEIKYMGWLTKAGGSKKVSSMIIEFADAEDASMLARMMLMYCSFLLDPPISDFTIYQEICRLDALHCRGICPCVTFSYRILPKVIRQACRFCVIGDPP
ncbi:MAG: hypothetical protein M1824_002466 [Vezdaea acicularis]|nr:MAG: hypothetical protein M1824_002466 [Vezdaea acicularis]